MLIIGCDFHPGFQQVAIFDNLTGEIQEERLQHRGEAEQFYRSLAGQQVRVGMEAWYGPGACLTKRTGDIPDTIVNSPRPVEERHALESEQCDGRESAVCAGV
jgi:PP-loop superfamily ATP-utilizing enzyme